MNYWKIDGYAGFYDCDGPSDYNIDTHMYLDESITKDEVYALLQYRYRKYRVTVFSVKKEQNYQLYQLEQEN